MATSKSAMLNTEVLDKLYPTYMNVGGHKVEIRSFREIAGHDDSMPFQAKVFVDGKEMGIAYNDGWGGPTNVQATKEGMYPVMNEVEKYIRDHKEEFSMGEYDGIKLYHTSLDSICETLAINCANRKDAEKYADRALILYNPSTQGVSRISFTKKKSTKLSELVGSHQFRTLWFDTIAKYEDKGYTILSIKDIFTPFRKVG